MSLDARQAKVLVRELHESAKAKRKKRRSPSTIAGKLEMARELRDESRLHESITNLESKYRAILYELLMIEESHAVLEARARCSWV